MIRTVLAAFLAGFAVVAMTGCTETLKQEELTESISENYKEQVGAELTEIECDDSIEATKGQKFTCKANQSGELELEIEGEVGDKDDETDKYQMAWKVVSATADGSFFNSSVADTVASNFGVAVKEASCPDGIEMKAGTAIDCDLTAADGSTGTAKVTLTDSEGGFRVKIE